MDKRRPLRDARTVSAIFESASLAPTTSLGHHSDGWVAIAQLCVLKFGITAFIGTTFVAEMRRFCSGPKRSSGHGLTGSGTTDASPRDQQVQALLRGDLSCLEVRSCLSSQNVITVRSARDGIRRGTASGGPERRKRPMGQHNRPDSSSSTSSSKDDNSTSRVVKDLDYTRFRKRMERTRHNSFRRQQHLAQGGGPAAQDHGEERAHASRVLSYSAGLIEKKELGQVRGLIGTVLGKRPPSSSPFLYTKAKSSISSTSSLLDISDTDSVEIAFD
jgi:hypothetical protein